MSDYTKYTKQEMQAYAIAKNIKENQIVIVGTGLPLIGASLAKRAVCPSCHPIVESGLMDCDPVEVPRSVGDNRFMAHCAVQWPNIRFVGFEANEWLHDEDRLVAFIGGAQIDPSRTLWNLDRALTACLEPLLKESAASLTERRYQKFRALGRGKEDA